MKSEKLHLTRSAGGALIAAGIVAVAGTTAPDARAGTLRTDDQKKHEELLLKVLAAKPMQDEIKRTAELYATQQPAKLPDAPGTIPSASHTIGVAAVQYAISLDPTRAFLAWDFNAPHRWFGLDAPRSGFGIDNPDNVYRQIGIDGSAKYTIRGKTIRPGPAQETFMIYGAVPGTRADDLTNDAGQVLAVLSSDQIERDPDGSFTITVDGESAKGGENHIQIPSGTSILIVRDTLSDWTAQNAADIKIEKVGGDAKAASVDSMAQQASELLAKMAPFWVTYFDKFIYSFGPNTVIPAFPRKGGWGGATNGSFNLTDDEAMVITLDPIGAKYLGFQLTDPWGVSRDYVNHTESLNSTQAKPNQDGTYTYVISYKDPGVYNWLDPVGLHGGLIAVRWQSVPAGADYEHAVKEAKVVKLSALRESLPAGAVFVDGAERKAQLDARVKSYERRLQ